MTTNKIPTANVIAGFILGLPAFLLGTTIGFTAAAYREGWEKGASDWRELSEYGKDKAQEK